MALRKGRAETMFVMWGRIWFQIDGPKTKKVCFPNWVHVLMTTAALVVEMPAKVEDWFHSFNVLTSRWVTEMVPSRRVTEMVPSPKIVLLQRLPKFT